MQNQIENLTSQYTILVVDDVPTNIMLAQAILKKAGYTLLTTDNGVKAFRIAREKRPNLILLDILMPEMDGYEVLQQLKSDPDTHHIPVIIMSALNDMQSIIKGYRMGAAEYVTKPFQREELLQRVAHYYEIYNIKRIKQDLEETIEFRNMLYSVIVHNLHSPLGSLKMLSNAILTMASKEQVSDDMYETLQLMNQTSEETYQLLDNLMKWTKVRQNHQGIYKQQVDINSIIHSTAEIFAPLARRKHISLKLENLDKGLIGTTDIDMLKTIVRNLVSNAVKYSYENGMVTVSTRTEEDFVIITVEDKGKGIRKEGQEKLLDPNSHYTTYGTNNEKGPGLGLLLCKEFAELLDGKLWFDSEVGKGSVFYCSLKAWNQE